MQKQLLKDTFGWGFVLWLFGYILGIVLIMLVPKDMIGWVIMPIGTIASLLVLTKIIKGTGIGYYLKLSAVWTLLAIVLDYFFIVNAFGATDYYKPDVYLYYAFTFLLPVIVGWKKR